VQCEEKREVRKQKEKRDSKPIYKKSERGTNPLGRTRNYKATRRLIRPNEKTEGGNPKKIRPSMNGVRNTLNLNAKDMTKRPRGKAPEQRRPKLCGDFWEDAKLSVH